MEPLKTRIQALAEKYAKKLDAQIIDRMQELEDDNKSHHLIYQLFGIGQQEGISIDLYHNKGRFLYKYAGSFFEEAVTLCFENKFPDAKSKVKLPNSRGKQPKTFEIDCLVENRAYEIKWRDATTDGDHVKKEHARVHAVHRAGHIPVRLMFYSPNRDGAIRIQKALETVYEKASGFYYAGPAAWEHLRTVTDVDLHALLCEIAESKAQQAGSLVL